MSFFEDDVPEIKQENANQPSAFADDVITLGAPVQEQPQQQQQPIQMQPVQNSLLDQVEEDDGSISVSMTSADSPLGYLSFPFLFSFILSFFTSFHPFFFILAENGNKHIKLSLNNV